MNCKGMMNMSTLNTYFETIKNRGFRLTKNRISIIEILENKHLTFKEIQKELSKRGLNNVASIYNNLDFLVSEGIVAEIPVGNKKYYDLALDNPGHTKDSHIHIVLKDTNTITEINDEDIFKYIIDHPSLSKYDLKYIKIVIGAKTKD